MLKYLYSHQCTLRGVLNITYYSLNIKLGKMLLLETEKQIEKLSEAELENEWIMQKRASVSH